MRIRFAIAGLICFGVVQGCGPRNQLAQRLDLVDQQLVDLQQANRRLSVRLDELQIQLSLLQKRLAAGPTEGSGARQGLEVVKLHPPSVPVTNSARPAKVQSAPHAEPYAEPQGRQRPPQGQQRLPPVEPSDVTEQLAVDYRAAKKPLVDPAAAAPAGGRAPGDGWDEESVAKEFQLAMAPFRAADYRGALEALDRFSRTYPEHPLSAEAQFYAGQARFERGDFRQAEQIFVAIADRGTDGKLAAGALLMAGRCEEKLGRRGDARNLYLQLVQSYPLSEEAVLANQRLESIQ